MRKKLLCWMLFLTAFYHLKAQEFTQSLRDDLNYGSFKLSPQRSTIYGVEGSKGTVQGDVYLDSAWHTAELFFYPEVVRRYDPEASDSVGGYKVRVEVVDYTVEFLIDNTVKAIEENAVKKLRWQTNNKVVKLVNTRQYSGAEDVKGFYEILSEGQLTVLKYTRIQVIQPTFNVALNVGTKDAKLIQKPEYYYVKGTQSTTLTKFKPTKSALLDLMNNKKTSVEKYLKTNDLSLKEEQDLVKVLNFYNTGN